MKKTLLLLTFLLLSLNSFAQADLVITNTDYQSTYIPGTTNTYTISITNFGPQVATNVHVVNAIPAGVNYFTWTGSNGSAGTYVQLDNTVPSIAVGATVSYTVNIEVPGAQTGNLVNQVVVTSTTVDPTPACPQCTDTDTKAVGADISVTNTNNQTIYIPGSTSVYTVTVKNNGPLTAANVHVTNAIPAGITSFSWTGSNGTSGTNIALDDMLTSFPADTQVVYTITVQIPAAYTGNLTSQTVIATPTVDPVPGCPQCTDTDTQVSGADIEVVNTDGQTSYTPGDTNTYTVTVTNNGPAVATNVHVVNLIPAGISSFSWTGSNGSSGTNVNLDNTLATLAVGATVTYTITMDVPAAFSGDLTSVTSITSTTTDPFPTCDDCSDTDTMNIAADLVVVNTDNLDAYIPGTNNIYTVTVTNNGPHAAVNVNVTNAIPAGITAFSWTGSNGSNGTNVALNNTIPILANGETVTYTITLGVPGAFTGNLTSQTVVTSLTNDQNPGCTACTDTDIQAVGADVVVVNTNGQTVYLPGTSPVYTVTVTNNGPAAATNVHVTNAIPAGITLFSWTGSNGSSGTNTNLDNTIANLAVGATVTYTITLQIPAGFTGNLTSQTVATSTTPDPNPTCLQCTDTDILEEMDLVVVNTNNQTVYVPGTPAVYTVTVTNNGPAPALNVHVTNAIPAGITAFSWTGSNGSSGTNVALDNTIPSLASGATVTYTITLQVPAGYTGNLTSQTVTTSPTTDINPGCTTCTDTDTLAVGADIVVTKTDGSTTYTAGAQTVYTITVTNNGPSPAANVVIQDLVPAGIPAASVTWTGTTGSGTGNLNQNVATLNVGQVLTYTVTVAVPSNYNQETDLVNTVSVTSTTADPNPGCTTCTDTDTPAPSANLITLKSDNSNFFWNEENSVYNITVSNVGPSDAVNVQVNDLMPPGITQMTWVGSNGSSGTGNLVDVIASLPAGQVVTYSVTMSIPENYDLIYDDQITNTVSITSDTPDPVPACPGCIDVNDDAPNYVTIKINQFTVEQLVEDILIHSECANVSNFTAVAGGGNIGIGYFDNNNSDFPLEKGVIISCGAAANFQGPFTDTNLSSTASGAGSTDAQLQAISVANGQPLTVSDVSYIKFDFVPLTDNFSFDFLFASNEYGTYQCTFGDVFAFILTDLTAGGPPVNLAVIPGTATPVSVTSIRNGAHNGACGSVNPGYFDRFNPDDPTNAAINMRGQTVEMKASATVIPNHTYSIKLIIGDYQDQQFDSAVFIEAGSFNVGQAKLEGENFAGFEDLTMANGGAVCDGGSIELQAGSSAIAGATYTWALNDVVIPGSDYTLEIDEPGIYTVNIVIGGATGCAQSDSMIVEFQPPLPFTDPTSLSSCEHFDLDDIKPEIFVGLNPNDYDVFYHHSLADAQNVFNEITTPNDYVGTEGEIIYVSIQDILNGGCIGIKQFVLHVSTCGEPTDPDDLYICDDASNDGDAIFDLTPQTAVVLGTNDATDFTITYHHTQAEADADANPIATPLLSAYPGTDGEIIYVRMEDNTDPDYGTTSFVLHVLPLPTATIGGTATVCVGAASPVVTFTGAGGTAPYIFTYTDASGSHTIPSAGAGNTATISVPTTAPGTFTYTLVSVEDSSSEHCSQAQSGTVTVTVSPLPTATIGSDAAVCVGGTNPVITLTGAGGTAPYTFTYTDASGSHTIPSAGTGDTATISVPTTAPGSFTYTLVSVSDSSPGACSQAQTGTATITVNPLPTATIGSDATVCVGGTSPVITFTGAGGTAPYTFTYTDASGSHTIVSTGNIATIDDAPTGTPGTFIYTLVSVQDSSSTACSQLQSGTATITVNPLPTATITANATQVCVGGTAPVITITGAGGTAPYTFTYNINTGAPQTIPSTGNTATITVPVGTPGVFDYHLISVLDSSATGCSQAQPATVTVTVTAYPVIADPADVTSCQSYQLPALAVGGYFSSPGGLNPITDTLLTTDQTVYIYAQTGTVPNCTSENSFDVTIVDPPTAVTPTPLQVCDDNTDGISCLFVLSDKDAEITASQPGLVVTYHETPEDADNGVLPLANNYCNIDPGIQVIYARVFDPAAPTCESVVPLQLVVNPLPIVDHVIPPYPLCDYDNPGDGVEPFDLQGLTTAILGSLTGVTVTYYTDAANAASETSPITVNPHVSGNATIWVRLENNTTGCYTVSSFELVVNALPLVVDPAPMNACSDGVTNTAAFNLPLNDSFISGGVPGVTVSYYLTQANADNEVSPLPVPYTSGPTTVYVRVENNDTGCYDTTTLQLNVTQGPVANVPTPLEECDPNSDCFTEFDLSQANNEISGGSVPAGVTITYHETETDAVNGVNDLPTLYTNIDPCTQTIYVRVSYDLTGCANIVPLQLIVHDTPQGNEDVSLEVCDDNTDGVGTFNLTLAIAELLQGPEGDLAAADHTVTFYVNQPNAQAGTNAIAGVLAYSSASGTIWVRIENNITHCFDVVPLELIVNPLPLVDFPVITYTVCDDNNPGDNQEVFDLQSWVDEVLEGQVGMVVTFHQTQADAIANTNQLPDMYTTGPVETIGVRVENVVTHCFVTSTLDLRVEPLPTLIPPPGPIVACDPDRNCFAEFNLDALIPGMVMGAPGITVTFHDNLAEANDGLNPLVSPYQNIDPCVQFIYVRAVNAFGCHSVMMIELNVNPAPAIPNDLPNLSQCDTDSNNQDGISVFNLTAQTPAILAEQTGPAADYQVKYHLTLAAAQAATPAITSEAAFTNNVPFDQEIWYSVKDMVTGCISTGSFHLIVTAPLQLPIGLSYTLCDDGATAPIPTTEFDLTVMEPAVLVNAALGTTYTVTYYTQAGYLTGTPIGDPEHYTNAVNPEVIHVVVSGPSPSTCTSHTYFTIRVAPRPTPKTDPVAIEKCDDVNSPDMVEIFDLTVNETYIRDNDPTLTFTYYTTLAGALAEDATAQILTPTTYQMGSGIVYIRVENTHMSTFSGNCFEIVEQEVIVHPLPVVAAAPVLFTQCDVNNTGFMVFDLTASAPDGVMDQVLLETNPGDFTVSYYLTAADAATGTATGQILAPATFTNTSNPQDVYVRVVNNLTGCVNATAIITLEVREGAIANPVAAQFECGDTDGLFTFDLTTFDADILGTTQTPPDFTVAYYTDPADIPASIIATPDSFETDSTSVWAVVTNNLTGCTDMTEIVLEVEPQLEPGIVSDHGNTICVEAGTENVVSAPLLSVTPAMPAGSTYQWLLDGDPIAGATASTYQIPVNNDPQTGLYTVEVTSPNGCPAVVPLGLNIIRSGMAQITGYTVTNAFADNQVITVTVIGYGDYEYSLDNGPFLDNGGVFENVSPGVHTVIVRDMNQSSCGDTTPFEVTAINYPHFFTPNGDGVNDTWNIIGMQSLDANAKIYIFDRYGKLLKQISPAGEGWNGTFNGQMLPSTDYWFSVFYNEAGAGKEFKAHFSLKR